MASADDEQLAASAHQQSHRAGLSDITFINGTVLTKEAESHICPDPSQYIAVAVEAAFFDSLGGCFHGDGHIAHYITWWPPAESKERSDMVLVVRGGRYGELVLGCWS